MWRLKSFILIAFIIPLVACGSQPSIRKHCKTNPFHLKELSNFTRCECELSDEGLLSLIKECSQNKFELIDSFKNEERKGCSREEGEGEKRCLQDKENPISLIKAKNQKNKSGRGETQNCYYKNHSLISQELNGDWVETKLLTKNDLDYCPFGIQYLGKPKDGKHKYIFILAKDKESFEKNEARHKSESTGKNDPKPAGKNNPKANKKSHKRHIQSQRKNNPKPAGKNNPKPAGKNNPKANKKSHKRHIQSQRKREPKEIYWTLIYDSSKNATFDAQEEMIRSLKNINNRRINIENYFIASGEDIEEQSYEDSFIIALKKNMPVKYSNFVISFNEIKQRLQESKTNRILWITHDSTSARQSEFKKIPSEINLWEHYIFVLANQNGTCPISGVKRQEIDKERGLHFFCIPLQNLENKLKSLPRKFNR